MIVTRVLPALALLFAGFTLAQTQQSAATASITGTVRNGATNESIEDVVVTVTSETGAAKAGTGNSDREGRFAIMGLAEGRYVVSAARSGFTRDSANRGEELLTVAPGERIQDVRLRLVPTAAIEGRVVDESGKPLARVAVAALRPRYDRGRRIMSVCVPGTADKRTGTDERGGFRLFGLEPGEYYLAVTTDPCNSAPQFFPNAVDPADSQRITVRPGGTAGPIDFQLSTRVLHAVRFKIEEPDPQGGFRNLLFVRRSRNGIDVTEAYLQQSTRAATPIPPLPSGGYEVYVSTTIAGVPREHLTVFIGDDDVDAGTVTMKPPVMVEGSISAADGRVVLEQLRVRLAALDGQEENLSRVVPGLNLTTRVRADGTFTAQVAAEWGHYRVEVAGLPAGAYLDSAQYGGRDILGSGLIVDRTSSPRLDLKLENHGGVVGGIVRDTADKPVTGSTVVLIPPAGRRTDSALFRTAKTDQFGRFSIRDVRPGNYGLVAWEDVEIGAWENAEFLRPIEIRSAPIEVLGDSTADVPLRVVAVPRN